MTTQRRIARVVNVPPLAPGFAGAGHTAAPVISMEEFAQTDPFIALMDDHLDMGARQVGGAHPHAGFETVTLLLDGTIHDPDEGGLIHAGEVQWMTAGRGIIHGENARALGKVRLLQLWLTLPKADRWTAPGFQDLHVDRVPVRREPGVDVRVYSGASGGVQAPTRNQVPVTIVEMTMKSTRIDRAGPACDVQRIRRSSSTVPCALVRTRRRSSAIKLDGSIDLTVRVEASCASPHKRKARASCSMPASPRARPSWRRGRSSVTPSTTSSGRTRSTARVDSRV